MELIDADNAEEYLRNTNRIRPVEDVRVELLTGGVSNVVLRVHRQGGPDFILKQAREQLRVPQPWFCSVERIWREVAVLKLCARLLDGQPPGESTITTPEVLFVDQDNYLFAMSAAPAHDVWKSQLLGGVANAEIASACGRLMGRLHGASWRDESVESQIGDQSFFRDLRIDPYYRRVAEVHPDLSPSITRLIESIEQHPLCLVHGDFSPKNLLVFDGGLMLVDFEVGHFGDPAFDIGFFATHLTLKALRAAPNSAPYFNLLDSFWAAYLKTMQTRVSNDELADLNHRAAMNLAGCSLARVDGKSQVEYLDDSQRDKVRVLCRQALLDGELTWSAFRSAASKTFI